ncbi:MAG TPA: ABC transporter ATP-binding protein [Longimicrobiales bacterium]|nr:ABC transporter ATP-binding protein [Longimicrobiales bacterium]
MRIELRDVRKDFGCVRALDGISLDLEPGSRVALVGPNGSGKSTLVRILAGMLRYQGVVRLDGRDPLSERAALAPRMAYVPQSEPELAATVGEISRAVARLRGVDLLRIHEVAAALGLDVRAMGARRVRSLSAGTKQKLSIALSLAAPVSLLLMDEPTASLDPRTRAAFFALFEERSPGATLVLSSHRLQEVRRLVDRVVALEDGRLVADGPAHAPEVARRMGVA